MTNCMFENHCIISCGMLHPEITHLIKMGFMNPRRLFFTPPGLHAVPDGLEKHLLKRLAQARKWCPDDKIIVVYGKKCYVNADTPHKRVESILQAAGQGITRVQGDYGYDMLASFEDRQRISGGRQDKILWFTPGWLRSWRTVYQRYFGWDSADANANFPGFYDKIIVLDSLGLGEKYMTDNAETILEVFDWTGLEVEFQPISLDRLKGLLKAAVSPTALRGASESQRAKGGRSIKGELSIGIDRSLSARSGSIVPAIREDAGPIATACSSQKDGGNHRIESKEEGQRCLMDRRHG